MYKVTPERYYIDMDIQGYIRLFKNSIHVSCISNTWKLHDILVACLYGGEHAVTTVLRKNGSHFKFEEEIEKDVNMFLVEFEKAMRSRGNDMQDYLLWGLEILKGINRK